MDSERFSDACNKILNSPRSKKGIGTLSEKTLHAVLKEYFEPYTESHEAKVGGYVADIVGEKGIIEIQTGDLGRLRKKLETFLKVCDVTVVYPMAGIKYLRWLDTQTGELSDRRRSPRKMTVYDGIAELYRIKYLLKDPRLHICFCLIEMEEIRYLNGWSKDGKKGSSRCDKIPVRLIEEIHIDGASDYRRFVPDGLPKEFTSKDFAKHCRIKLAAAQTILNVLTFTECVERCGKNGRSILYTLPEKSGENL